MAKHSVSSAVAALLASLQPTSAEEVCTMHHSEDTSEEVCTMHHSEGTSEEVCTMHHSEGTSEEVCTMHHSKDTSEEVCTMHHSEDISQEVCTMHHSEDTSEEVCTLSPPEGPSIVPCRKDEVCASQTERVSERPPPGLADCVYLHAAAIFENAHVEKPLGCHLVIYGNGRKSESPDAGDSPGVPAHASDPRAERQAYLLAFNTMKYQELLEDILIDSCFCLSQPMPDDLMALVVVMLFDLQDRKFLPREPITGEGDGHVEEVRRVESCLYRCKTRLAASLARCRVKRDLLSIDGILPESVRTKQERSHTLSLYAWVNTHTTSMEEVCEVLRADGFVEVDSHTLLSELLQSYCRDSLCPDLLVFPHHARAQLDTHTLITEYKLVIQDKSRSVCVCAVRPLLCEEGSRDVLMAGSFSALTVAHIAVLAAACSGRVYIAAGNAGSTHREELQGILSSMQCKNVCVCKESFEEMTEWDARFQKVRVILLLPQCSVSALNNPVEHILNEHGDKDLLQDLSQGSLSQSKLDSLVARQTQYLNHALSFPRVHAVVYCTCSVRVEENEELVTRALERAEPRAKLVPLRLVAPVMSMSGGSEGSELKGQKFLKLEVSEFTNGCFLCVLAREPDPAEKESVQVVLARAAALGLLEGIEAPPGPRKGHRRRARAGHADPPLPGAPLLSTSSSLPPLAGAPIPSSSPPLTGAPLPSSSPPLRPPLLSSAPSPPGASPNGRELQGWASGLQPTESNPAPCGVPRPPRGRRRKAARAHSTRRPRRAAASKPRTTPRGSPSRPPKPRTAPRGSPSRASRRPNASFSSSTKVSSNFSTSTTALKTSYPATRLHPQRRQPDIPTPATPLPPAAPLPTPTSPLRPTTPAPMMKPKQEVMNPRQEVIKPKQEVMKPKQEVMNPRQEVLRPLELVLPPVSQGSRTRLSSSPSFHHLLLSSSSSSCSLSRSSSSLPRERSSAVRHVKPWL